MSMLLQLLDVGACYKGPAGADDDNGSDGLICCRLVDGIRDSLRHSRGKCVDWRIVNRHYSYTAHYRYLNQFCHVLPQFLAFSIEHVAVGCYGLLLNAKSGNFPLLSEEGWPRHQ